MLIVRNKTEKIKMASYLEAAMEGFEVVIFKATGQLDLASLRDHKICCSQNSEMGKVYSATGSGKSFYKSFAVVVLPLTSLI